MVIQKFEKCTVADIAAPIKHSLVGGPFGSNLVSRDYTSFGVPVIRGQNMGFGRWVNGEYVFVSPQKAKELSSNIARPRDIVFTQRGTIGQVAIVPDRPYSEYVISQSQMKLTIDNTKADEKFFYYLFNTLEQQEYIQQNAIQTGVPHTNLEHLRNTPVVLPPLLVQKEIARILGLLDDKIELNHQMNETLEAMARAIFKSWFVDFDPVRAKVEGRDTGLPPYVAALFPDEFEEMDGMVVPVGWKLSKIGNELTTLLGGTPSRDVADYWQNGTIPWINSGKANEFRIIDPSEYITQSGLESSATKLLPERTTIVAITGATLGQVSLLEITTCANQSIVGVIGNEKLPNEFVYLWIKTNIDMLVSRQTGGAQQHINKNDVNDLEILIPSPTILQNFEQQMRPIFDIIKNNCMESRTLAQIRDALLPKLMSGEISVEGKLENENP